MNLSLTITRTSLSLPDLVISNDPTAGDFWLPEDGLEEPDVTLRLTYMPDARDVAGKELLASVEEHASLPFVVYTQPASAAALKVNKAVLRAALGQFTYDVTLDLDGESYTYSADPTTPRWGAVDSGMLRAHMARASVAIPVYPIAS